MSGSTFKQVYATQYDLLYSDKDYEVECDTIEAVFRSLGQTNITSVLDLGCGTGNHALSLASRGYEVVGIDLSSDMLACAREKVIAAQFPSGKPLPQFAYGDVRTANLGRQFDAVLMMFAVLGYQLTNDDVLSTLNTVRQHLKPGGMFVFDIWYGPAVLTIRPNERIKIVPTVNGRLIRATTGRLDTYRHECVVQYHLWQLIDDRVVAETEEVHSMRFFFPKELELMLTQSGLALASLTAFPALDRPADEATWNVLGVAHAF